MASETIGIAEGGQRQAMEEEFSDANETFETPPTGENATSFNEIVEESVLNGTEESITDGPELHVPDETPTPRLTISASCQDLRSLGVREAIRKAIKEEKEEEEDGEKESPRGVLDNGSRSSESETSFSKASTSCSGTQAFRGVPTQWKWLFRMWRQKSFRRLPSFSTVAVPKFRRRRSSREDQPGRSDAKMDSDFCLFKPSWKSFSLSELKKATSDFSPDNIIGKGGYAEVYKGCLEDGQLVAVKRLIRGTSEEQTSNFLSELGIIVHLNHSNTAKLIGFGVEGGMHLVLQLSPHGSLASRLHDTEEKMEWSVRYKIAIGTAQGLEYLHEKCARRIIHRDIKAANILLTENFDAQICDFGLAKWLPDQWTHHTFTNFEGTFGYLAPEYIMHGIVDEKTDVFAFGVLLLELITGRRALDSSQQSLVIWAMPLLEKNDIKELVDPSLGDAYNNAQLNCAVSTASQCIQQSPIQRPKMSEVLKLLRDEDRSRPQRKVLQRTFSEELFDAEEYNATKYLNDLTRHQQVALEL